MQCDRADSRPVQSEASPGERHDETKSKAARPNEEASSVINQARKTEAQNKHSERLGRAGGHASQDCKRNESLMKATRRNVTTIPQQSILEEPGEDGGTRTFALSPKWHINIDCNRSSGSEHE